MRPQPRPDRRGRPSAVEQGAGSAGPQDGDVIDAVPPGEHRADHRQRLRTAIRALPGQAQPVADQPSQVDPLGEDCCRQQPGIRHQIALVEGRGDRAEVIRRSHPSGALSAWSDCSVARPIVPAQRSSARLRHAANDHRHSGSGLGRCATGCCTPPPASPAANARCSCAWLGPRPPERTGSHEDRRARAAPTGSWQHLTVHLCRPMRHARCVTLDRGHEPSPNSHRPAGSATTRAPPQPPRPRSCEWRSGPEPTAGTAVGCRARLSTG